MAVYKDEKELMNTDWQSKINQAKATGDYKLAAQYEQARNDKIANSNYTGNQQTTSNYTGWLDNTDYSAIGAQQMASGASWQDVLDTYNNRLNKTSGTVGMEKFVNDAKQQEMLDYILAKQGEPSFDFDYETRPTYNDNGMSNRIDEMLNQILNRDKFSYSAAEDPLYKQYATMYEREGTRAMNDAMASAAATAGGMNSYAMTAANQANNYYMAQMNDKIPELYQLAYDMYLQDIDNQVRDLGLLNDMDDKQYNRYRDTMSDWENDRNFAYGMYQDDVAKDQWQQQFDTTNNHWQQEFDSSNNHWQNEFDHMVSEDALAQQNRDQEWAWETGQTTGSTAWNKAMEMLNSGAMPDAKMLKEAGMTEQQAATILATLKAQGALGGTTGTTGSTSSGGGDNSSNKTSDKKKTGGGYDNGGLTSAQVKELQKYYGVTADGLWGSGSKKAAGGLSADEAWAAYKNGDGDGGDEPELNWSSMINLGIGPVSATYVAEIAAAGGIVEDGKGNVSWAPGWNADNYEEKMKLKPFGLDLFGIH